MYIKFFRKISYKSLKWVDFLEMGGQEMFEKIYAGFFLSSSSLDFFEVSQIFSDFFLQVAICYIFFKFPNSKFVWRNFYKSLNGRIGPPKGSMQGV